MDEAFRLYYFKEMIKEKYKVFHNPFFVMHYYSMINNFVYHLQYDIIINNNLISGDVSFGLDNSKLFDFQSEYRKINHANRIMTRLFLNSFHKIEIPEHNIEKEIKKNELERKGILIPNIKNLSKIFGKEYIDQVTIQAFLHGDSKITVNFKYAVSFEIYEDKNVSHFRTAYFNELEEISSNNISDSILKRFIDNSLKVYRKENG